MKKRTGREPQESGGRPQGGRLARTPKWRTSPEPLVTRFEHAVAGLPEVLQRKMFGYPAAFVNGHMFAGVFQASLFVRLAEKESIVESEAKLTAWFSRALRYAASLPPTSRK